MASNKIKGITIEIGADLTKLDKAINDATKTSKDLNDELKQVNKMLKFDPQNVELLTQKQQILTSQIENTSNKLEILKQAEAQVQAQFERGDIGADQYRAFQRELLSTEDYLQSLKNRLEDTQQEISGLSSETVKVSNAFDDLTTDIRKQESQLAELKKEYTNVVLSQGKTSDEAQELQSKMLSLNKELNDNKTKLSKAQDEADKLTSSFNKLGDEVKNKLAVNLEGGFTVVKGAVANLTSGAIQTAIGKVNEYVTSLFDLSEATEEYRRMLAKVEGSATNFGYEIEYAKDQYKEFYSYLKDDQMATNAITNLMGLQVETSTLDKLVNGAISTWSAYGDSIPIESLTESMNETIQVSKVTGVMADTINWASLTNEQWTKVLGKNSKAQKAFNKALEDGEAVEDAFSAALAATTDQGERANIVADMLNETYGESKEVYDDLSGSIIDANRAEADLKETQAELGETLQPLNTRFTELQNKVLKAMAPTVEEVTDNFIDLIDGIDWNKAGKLMGDTLEVLGNGLIFVIDNADKLVPALLGVGTAAGAFKAVNMLSSGIETFAKSMGTATAATKLFNLAQMATPWGLVASLVGGAVAAIGLYVAITKESTEATNENLTATEELVDEYDELNQKLESNKKARQENREAVEEEAGSALVLFKQLERLNDIENKSAGQKALMADVVRELNDIMPELNLQYDEEADKLNQSTDAIKKNIEQQKNLMMAKAAQEDLYEIAKEQYEVEKDLAEAELQHADNLQKKQEAQERYNDAYQAWVDAGSNQWSEEYAALVSANKELGLYTDATEQSTQLVADLSASQRELNDEFNKTSEYAENLVNEAEIDKQLTALQEKAKQAGVTIPASLAQGMREGNYAVPQSVEELNSLITYDSLVAKATTSGLQIPTKIAEGIANGSMKPSEAVTYMNNLVTFNDLLTKSSIAGQQVPDFLAQQVALGQLKPQEAINQMQNLVAYDDLLNKTSLAGVQTPEKLQQAILNGKIKPVQAVQQMKDESLKKINEMPKPFGNVGTQAINLFEGALKANDVSSIAKGIGDSGATALANTKSGFKTSGENVVQGAIDGVNNKSGSLWSTLSSVASNALSSFKRALGIASPSKAFEEASEWIPEGAAQGVEKNKKVALQAIQDMSEDMVKQAQGTELELNTHVNKPILNDDEISGNFDRQLNSTFTVGELNINQALDRIYSLLADILPNMSNDIYLDTGTMVGEMAPFMNEQLGTVNERNRRR